jgi:glycosyltransferase involved in cell wall biosynthesis
VLNKRADFNFHCGIIVGVSERWVRLALGDELYGTMSVSNAFKLFGKVEIPWTDWVVFDYVWKPCEDVSLTMTSLNAAAAGVPLVAHQGSFLGEFIEHFGIGVSVDPLEPVFSGNLIASDLNKAELWSRQSWRSGALSLVSPFKQRCGV